MKTRSEILSIVEYFYNRGIRQFVIIRGDGEILENGFKYASELVKEVRRSFFDAAIYVAGYPEKDSELQYLHEKASYGINGVVTQICFDNAFIGDFSNKTNIPVLPGVIYPSEKALGFASKHNISVPRELIGHAKINDSVRHKDDANAFDVEVKFADFEGARKAFLKNQVQNLVDRGFRHVHFYTLNNIDNLSFLFNS